MRQGTMWERHTGHRDTENRDTGAQEYLGAESAPRYACAPVPQGHRRTWAHLDMFFY